MKIRQDIVNTRHDKLITLIRGDCHIKTRCKHKNQTGKDNTRVRGQEKVKQDKMRQDQTKHERQDNTIEKKTRHATDCD